MNEWPASASSSNPVSVSGETSDDFTWLSQGRQILVFQTIQNALSADPPRTEASFGNVVAAYKRLTEVVAAAKNASLSDDCLEKLEQSILNVGGVIAPGLKAQGDHSLSSFRAASFGELRKNYDDHVVNAAIKALNAHLKKLELDDIGDVFNAIATFLDPVCSAVSNPPLHGVFTGFTSQVKSNVFMTLVDAYESNPQRPQANFESVVHAYNAENLLLSACQNGSFTHSQLLRYESSIDLAGGKLYPNTFSQGDHSIKAYRERVFAPLEEKLDEDVRASAHNTLNTLLAFLRPETLPDALKCIRAFYEPFTARSWDAPYLKVFVGFDKAKQIKVFKTLELIISNTRHYDSSTLSLAVRAIQNEAETIESAVNGVFSQDIVDAFIEVTKQCGGTIAGGVQAAGVGSIGSMRDIFYGRIKASLASDVFLALESALNARLKSAHIASISQLVETSLDFLYPVQQSLHSAFNLHAERDKSYLDMPEDRSTKFSGANAQVTEVPSGHTAGRQSLGVNEMIENLGDDQESSSPLAPILKSDVDTGDISALSLQDSSQHADLADLPAQSSDPATYFSSLAVNAVGTHQSERNDSSASSEREQLVATPLTEDYPYTRDPIILLQDRSNQSSALMLESLSASDQINVERSNSQLSDDPVVLFDLKQASLNAVDPVDSSNPHDASDAPSLTHPSGPVLSILPSSSSPEGDETDPVSLPVQLRRDDMASIADEKKKLTSISKPGGELVQSLGEVSQSSVTTSYDHGVVSEISTDKTSSLSENPSVLSAYDASSTSGLLSPADNQTDKEFFQSHDSIIAGICEGRSSSSVALFKALALGGSGLYPLEILRSSRSHGVKDLLRSSFRVKRSPCNENQVLYCLALIDQAGSRSIVLSRLNEERVYLLWREVVGLADDVRGRSDDVLGKDFSDAVLRVLGVLKNDASKLGLPWWLFCDNRLAALSPEVGALGEVVHLVVIANLGAKIDQLSGEQLDTLRLWLKSPIGVDFEWHPIARQLAKRFMELSGVISKKHAKVVALLELCSAMASRGL